MKRMNFPGRKAVRQQEAADRAVAYQDRVRREPEYRLRSRMGRAKQRSASLRSIAASEPDRGNSTP